MKPQIEILEARCVPALIPVITGTPDHYAIEWRESADGVIPDDADTIGIVIQSSGAVDLFWSVNGQHFFAHSVDGNFTPQPIADPHAELPMLSPDLFAAMLAAEEPETVEVWVDDVEVPAELAAEDAPELWFVNADLSPSDYGLDTEEGEWMNMELAVDELSENFSDMAF